MTNENLLKEELQVTLKSQGEELILDTFEQEYKENSTEIVIQENEIDTEAFYVEEIFMSKKGEIVSKVKEAIKEKQKDLPNTLTPEQRQIEIRKLTMEIYNEFEVEYLANIKQYVFDNWDRLVAETKRRKEALNEPEWKAGDNVGVDVENGIELVPQYEKVEMESIPSQPEPQIKALTTPVEQVKVEEIKVEIKPIVESNDILDFDSFEFLDKYQKYYMEEMPPLDKIEIIDNGAEFKSTDKRLSIKLPNGLILNEKDRTTNKNMNVMWWYAWDEAHKNNKSDTIDYSAKNTIKNELFSQYFITKTRIEVAEGTYEIPQPEISTHVSLPVETKDELLPNGNTLRTYLEEDGMKVEMNPNKEVVAVNGIELDFGWFNKVNVLRRFSPDDFVRSEYYREQIALKKEKEDEELIPDFTKLKVEKKEEIQLPSFAMDLGMGV